jgi:hypothetical protein
VVVVAVAVLLLLLLLLHADLYRVASPWVETPNAA